MVLREDPKWSVVQVKQKKVKGRETRGVLNSHYGKRCPRGLRSTKGKVTGVQGIVEDLALVGVPRWTEVRGRKRNYREETPDCVSILEVIVEIHNFKGLDIRVDLFPGRGLEIDVRSTKGSKGRDRSLSCPEFGSVATD